MMLTQPRATFFSLPNILTPPVLNNIFPTECARCGLAQYCSKECQKRHWKQHKIECLKCQDGDHQTALNKKLGWRMDQFSNFYTPLIAKLVLDMYSRHNKQFNTGDILFPENAVVELALADLPQSAKRPRLYIKQAFVAELSKYETEAAFSRASRPEPGYECVRYCLSYSYGTGEDETFFSYYQFQLPLSAAKQLKRIENKNVGEHLTAINSIAKGKNPKVYKVIKQVLKEKNG